MILYTPLAVESIFPPDEKAWENKRTVSIAHGSLTIEKGDEGTWIVAALHSSNPDDYMNADYQPGSVWNES
ncbi:hypothetical protein D7Z54_11380 [Salibacterium salarium]|uniref:YlzJ-like protein n=1 Tax=Salibacterium salarium TaxID=284579 RepID=A0A428N4P9_9BACI|nr:YlzJ-like family protein [Salibacterium salarium]RSL33222.1 hypothetical protein D7Z54_11380 [Salibacterium salarium]